MVDKSNPIFIKGEANLKFKVENSEDGVGYLSKNESKIGLVLISEWWGLNKSIVTTAEIFAKNGFKVLVPDVYRGQIAEDREHAGHLLSGLNFKQAVADILGGVAYLKSNGCERVSVTGFCMGGALALAAASSTDTIHSVIPFYGVPDQSYFPVENIKCPVLMHVGSKDDLKGFSDPEHCKATKEKAEKAGVKFELIIWEGAQHAFFNQDSERFSKETQEKSLEKTLEFLKN